MSERKYLHTTSELIDRLSIVLMKSIFISEKRDSYLDEINLIKHDLDIALLDTENGNANFIYAILVLMLANRVIWENESEARKGSDKQNDRLRFTHSINGVRNVAKNEIARHMGEREDLKTDCLAAGLPEEFGNWVVW